MLIIFQVAVTRYKDVEDTSSSIYSQGDPYDPVLDFGRFLDDNDTIVDTDIIVWVTTGYYHIPHAEDVPSSATMDGQCDVTIRPYNFFNHCPSLAVSDAVTVTSEPVTGTLKFETFGTSSQESECYQKETSFKESFTGKIDKL